MSWSGEYKRSIDCDNPKGFSQKAHCAARKKRQRGEVTKSKSPFGESKEVTSYTKFTHKTKHLSKTQHQLDPNLDLKHLVHHTVHQYVDRDADGDIDVYDNPKKKTPDENVMSAPDEAEKRSKKLIAKQKGELKHTRRGMAYEETKSGDEGLRDWFGKSKSSDGKSGWVQLGGKWAGKPCARQPGQTSTPKCGSSKMAANMSDKEEERARRRKNRQDPNQPEKTGGAAPTNVKTEEVNLQEVKDKPGKGSGKKDACYHKVKSRYSVWPSAYASGALVKCRKVGAKNWGTKTEEVAMIRYCPKCEKEETREECKYGPRYWDMYSTPVALTTNQMKYNIAQIHPTNEEKDHEFSMARSELSTIISAAKRLKKKMAKGEGGIEAWVQSKITKAADYIDTAADYIESGEHNVDEAKKCWPGYKKVGTQKLFGKTYNRCVKEETCPVCGLNPCQCLEGTVESFTIDKGAHKKAQKREKIRALVNVGVGGERDAARGKLGVTAELPRLKEFAQFMEDWQKVNRQDKTDGLSQAAVDAYRRENPGSKLQTAVTEKKPTGKRAKRRANFCRRMKGMKSKLTSAKTARDPDSRINKALRRWNCN